MIEALPEELIQALVALRRRRWTGEVTLHLGGGEVIAYDVTERVAIDRNRRTAEHEVAGRKT